MNKNNFHIIRQGAHIYATQLSFSIYNDRVLLNLEDKCQCLVTLVVAMGNYPVLFFKNINPCHELNTINTKTFQVK